MEHVANISIGTFAELWLRASRVGSVDLGQDKTRVECEGVTYVFCLNSYGLNLDSLEYALSVYISRGETTVFRGVSTHDQNRIMAYVATLKCFANIPESFEVARKSF